jgi:hypothetical protein
MKAIKHVFSLLFLAGIVNITQVKAQSDVPDSTGLPGDNFSLQGAVEIFKKANTVEEFEKMINTESNNVNNLDLNNDGSIDYVKVIDKKDGDVHVFVLQAVVSETESQDIAVIELEKTSNDNAVLQIVGDKDIYGEETIVEPSSTTGDVSFINVGEVINHGPSQANELFESNNGIVVNVWMWPCVRFVYAPSYVVWLSPWRWHAHPTWWHPWRPVRYAVFYPRRTFYHTHYTVVHSHRVVRARTIYTPVRVTSVTVRTRNQASVTRYRTTRTATVNRNQGARQVQTTRRTATANRNNNSRPVKKSTRTVRKQTRRN